MPNAANGDQKAQNENNFKWHPPTSPEQVKLYETIREKYKELADFIVDNTPRSREQSLALTDLEKSMWAANASVARNS